VVQAIKFERVEIREPYFDPNPQKSKTNNQSWRKCLMIVFKTKDGDEFHYMPRWDELSTISQSKSAIETMNKQLYLDSLREEK
jgi:hypothetical protein